MAFIACNCDLDADSYIYDACTYACIYTSTDRHIGGNTTHTYVNQYIIM